MAFGGIYQGMKTIEKASFEKINKLGGEGEVRKLKDFMTWKKYSQGQNDKIGVCYCREECIVNIRGGAAQVMRRQTYNQVVIQ